MWINRAIFWPPVWSPTGDRLVYSLQKPDGTQDVYLRALNSSAAAPLFVRGSVFQPAVWLPDGRVFGSDWTSRVMSVRIDQQPTTIDTLLCDALYGTPSPDGKWIAYAQLGENAVWLEPMPRNGKRYPLHSGSNADDPQWLSPTELVFKSYERWGFDRVTITACASNPVGPVRRWFRGGYDELWRLPPMRIARVTCALVVQ